MSGRNSTLLGLGALAVAVAGGTGWFLLRTERSPGGAGRETEPSPGIERTGGSEGGSTDGAGKTAPPAPKPPPVEVDERDESDIDGEQGGADPELILAAIAKGDWQEAENLLRAGCSDPRVTEAWLRGLADDRWRFKVADLAKYLKDPQLMTRLLDLARKEGAEYTRAAALKAAAAVGGPEVFDASLEILRGSKPGSLLYNNAVLALGALGTPEAARFLADGLKGAVGKPEAAAYLGALGQIHDPAALASLGEMLGDGGNPPEVRAALAEALGRTHDPAVVNDLLRLVRETEDIELRGAGYRALALVGSPEAVAELLQVYHGAENDRRILAAQALAGVASKAAAPALAEALGSPNDPVLRSHLVAALGKAGTKDSLPALDAVAANESEDMGLRAMAVRSMKEIGHPAAAPLAVDLLEKVPPGEANRAFRNQCLALLAEVSPAAEERPRIQKLRDATAEGSLERMMLDGILARMAPPPAPGSK